MKKYLVTLLTSIFLFGCSENKPTLYVYCWTDYISPEVLLEFEKEYNCNVSITTFDSNEAAYAKLKSGASGYDVMIPSSYMIGLLSEEGLIEKIDHSRIPTVTSNFYHRFDSQIYDSNMTYSVPYLVTYTGLMYDKKSVPIENGEVSWNFLLETKLKYSLLDDMREIIGIGLMLNGYSLNSENEEEIEKATETLLKMKKNIRKFDAESYKTEISNGSLKLGHGYSSDSFQIIIGDEEGSEREDIGFVLPKEGFTIAFDELVIMRKSKNKDLAYKFVDFMYRTENSLRNMIYNFSPSPNENALEQLPENYKKVIVLDENTIKRGQVMRSFKDKRTNDLYGKALDKIRVVGK